MPVTNMYRTRTVWTGIAGTPYLQTLFFDATVGTAQQVVNELETSYLAMAGLFSVNLDVVVDTTVDEVDPVTGNIVAQHGVTATPQGGSDSTDILPAGTNGYIILNTGAFRAGRQIRGRFYLPGPCEGQNHAVGAPLSSYADSMIANVSALVQQATVNLVVWSRLHGEWFPISAYGRPSGWARLTTRRN